MSNSVMCYVGPGIVYKDQLDDYETSEPIKTQTTSIFWIKSMPHKSTNSNEEANQTIIYLTSNTKYFTKSEKIN